MSIWVFALKKFKPSHRVGDPIVSTSESTIIVIVGSDQRLSYPSSQCPLHTLPFQVYKLGVSRDAKVIRGQSEDFHPLQTITLVLPIAMLTAKPIECQCPCFAYVLQSHRNTCPSVSVLHFKPCHTLSLQTRCRIEKSDHTQGP